MLYGIAGAQSFRALGETCPNPVWQEDEGGPYLDLSRRECIYLVQDLLSSSAVELAFEVELLEDVPPQELQILYDAKQNTRNYSRRRTWFSGGKKGQRHTVFFHCPNASTTPNPEWDVLLTHNPKWEGFEARDQMKTTFADQDYLRGPWKLRSLKAGTIETGGGSIGSQIRHQFLYSGELWFWEWLPYLMALILMLIGAFSARSLIALVQLCLLLPALVLIFPQIMQATDSLMRVEGVLETRLKETMIARLQKSQQMESELAGRFEQESREMEQSIRNQVLLLQKKGVILSPESKEKRCTHPLEKYLEGFRELYGQRIILAGPDGTFACDPVYEMRLGRIFSGVFQNLLEMDRKLRFGGTHSDSAMGFVDIFSDLKQHLSSGMGDSHALEKLQNHPRVQVPLYTRGSPFQGRMALAAWSGFSIDEDVWFIFYESSEDLRLKHLAEMLEEEFEGQWYLAGSLGFENFPAQKAENREFSRMGALVQDTSGLHVNLSLSDHKTLVYGGVRLESANSFALVLQMDGTEEVRQAYKSWRWERGTGFVLALAVLFISAYASNRVTSVFQRLTAGIRHISEGNHGGFLKRLGRDEFAHLTDGFNQLVKVQQENRLMARFLNSRARQSLNAQSRKIERTSGSVFFLEFSLDTDLSLILQELEVLSHEYEGFVDKILGSTFMVVFPHAEERAQRLYSWMEEVRQLPDFGSLGGALGSLVVGPVGAENRRDFTAIGNTVNVSARLLSMAREKPVGTCFIEQELALHCPPESVRHLGSTLVKGKNQKVELYELA